MGSSYLSNKWLTGLSGSTSASFVVTGGPVFTSVNVSGNGSSIAFSGIGGSPNANYRILSSTNAAAPLHTWTPVKAGSFDSTGAFNTSVQINGAAPAGFYVLVSP
jgi:hypothetical protein